MRVGEKIAASMIMLMLIPLIASSIFSEVYSRNYCNSVCMEENRRSVVSMTEMLNRMFEKIISGMKDIAGDENIVEFTQSGGRSSVSVAEMHDYMEFFRYQQGASEIEIISTDGRVLASSDTSLIGKKPDIYIENAEENNGISSAFIHNTGNGEFICFSASRGIFTKTTRKIGTLYAVFSFQSLKDIGGTLKTGKYIHLVQVDTLQNLIDEPYTVLQRFDSYKQYAPAADVLTDIGGTQFEFSNDRIKQAAFSQVIECSGWRVVGIANLNEANKLRKSNSSINILFAVLSAAGIILLSIHFTAPLREMISFLDKKKKGDISVHLPYETVDEFGTISRLFNKVFDDLAGSEMRYRTIAEMSDDIVFEVSFKRNTVTVSNNFNNKFSFRPKNDSFRERIFYKWRIHKDDKDRFSADTESILTTNADKMKGEYRFKDKYGEFVWVLIKAKKLRDRNDVPYGIVGVIKDINKEKSNELHLINKASFDALTQLYNRSTFLKTLNDEIELSRHRSGLDAVLFVDLDDFKHFNDEYGHSCGDEVLKFTADTIKELCFGRGFGGRFGGDEFIACITGMTLIGDAGEIASEMIHILSEGFVSDSTGLTLSVTCSIGIAFFGEHGRTADEVIAAADSAMYRIKKHGKSDYSYAQADDKPSEATLKEGKPIDSDNAEQTDAGEDAAEE